MKYAVTSLSLALLALAASGCCWDHHGHKSYGGPPYGPPHDRPFPLGQVTDSHWETQQSNAEAADFIFYDHEFRRMTTGPTNVREETAQLSPLAKKKLEQVALRLEHAPFPVVIESFPRDHDAAKNHQKGLVEEARRKTVVEQLNRMGITNADERVVISNAFPEGITGVEGERAYWNIIGGGFGGGAGRRFGGTGGAYR